MNYTLVAPAFRSGSEMFLVGFSQNLQNEYNYARVILAKASCFFHYLPRPKVRGYYSN